MVRRESSSMFAFSSFGSESAVAMYKATTFSEDAILFCSVLLSRKCSSMFLGPMTKFFKVVPNPMSISRNQNFVSLFCCTVKPEDLLRVLSRRPELKDGGRRPRSAPTSRNTCPTGPLALPVHPPRNPRPRRSTIHLPPSLDRKFPHKHIRQ
jgi:hypothetical protein